MPKACMMVASYILVSQRQFILCQFQQLLRARFSSMSAIPCSTSNGSISPRASRPSCPILSNAAFSGRILQEELARHGLGDHRFRFVLTSADVNARKPGVAIFRAAVDRLGTDIAETWFVGDTWDEDILGASAAGLQPIWLLHGAANRAEASAVPVVHDWPEFLLLYSRCRAPAG